MLLSPANERDVFYGRPQIQNLKLVSIEWCTIGFLIEVNLYV